MASPGPNARATQGSGARDDAETFQDQEHGRRGNVAAGGQYLARDRGGASLEPQRRFHRIKDAGAPRVDGPGGDVVHAQALAVEPAREPGTEVRSDELGDSRREGHLEAVISDLPGHDVLGAGDQARPVGDDSPGLGRVRVRTAGRCRRRRASRPGRRHRRQTGHWPPRGRNPNHTGSAGCTTRRRTAARVPSGRCPRTRARLAGRSSAP